MKKKIKKKLRTRKEFIKSIIDYHRSLYTDGGFPTIFSLQQNMILKGICPRCGTPSRSWSSNSGYFPCWDCGFRITDNEIEKVCYENPKKWILNKRLKEKLKK